MMAYGRWFLSLRGLVRSKLRSRASLRLYSPWYEVSYSFGIRNQRSSCARISCI